ncbi:MAG: HlyC/CorC family transporter [Chloroflexi bacterium]|nr:HlyC/CorC family transporter [Chloroflexota bacterium]
MDPDSWIELLAVFFSLALAVYVAMADTALRLVNRAKLQRMIEEGVPRPQAVESFLERSGTLASTIVLVNTLAIIAASIFATVLVLRNFSNRYGTIILAGLAFVVFLAFSQLAPRLIIPHGAEGVSALIARPIELIAVVLSPFIKLAKMATGSVGSVLGVRRWIETPFITEGELRMIFEEEGIIEEEEREMIHGIFELEDTTAREIMVPRIDICALDANENIAAAIDTVVNNGYSRIPVYESSIDEIIGILYAKDIFKHLKQDATTTPVRDIVRPAYFIPESKKIDELLRELQQRKVHIAIVVDEYGGTAGLVTIEDLLEEIVGEIQDEYDIEEARIVELGEGEAVFDATVTIDDVNDTLGLKLEAEGVDTIGGLVYTQLGKMPTAGDEVRIDGVSITVLATDGRRIRKIKVNSHPDNLAAPAPGT